VLPVEREFKAVKVPPVPKPGIAGIIGTGIAFVSFLAYIITKK